MIRDNLKDFMDNFEKKFGVKEIKIAFSAKPKREDKTYTRDDGSSYAIKAKGGYTNKEILGYQMYRCGRDPTKGLNEAKWVLDEVARILSKLITRNQTLDEFANSLKIMLGYFAEHRIKDQVMQNILDGRGMKPLSPKYADIKNKWCLKVYGREQPILVKTCQLINSFYTFVRIRVKNKWISKKQ